MAAAQKVHEQVVRDAGWTLEMAATSSTRHRLWVILAKRVNEVTARWAAAERVASRLLHMGARAVGDRDRSRAIVATLCGGGVVSMSLSAIQSNGMFRAHRSCEARCQHLRMACRHGHQIEPRDARTLRKAIELALRSARASAASSASSTRLVIARRMPTHPPRPQPSSRNACLGSRTRPIGYRTPTLVATPSATGECLCRGLWSTAQLKN